MPGKRWPEAGREHGLGKEAGRGAENREVGGKNGESAGARPPVRFGGHGARLRPAGKTGSGLMSPTGGGRSTVRAQLEGREKLSQRERKIENERPPGYTQRIRLRNADRT